MSAHTVSQAQQALKDRGYDPGAIDGAEGPLTNKAVLAFQSDYGLRQTAKLDSDTLDALFNPNLRKPDMFSLPTIVQFIVTLLPGIPDDISLVEAELKEIASTDSGQQKLQAALKFGQALISKIEAALGIPNT